MSNLNDWAAIIKLQSEKSAQREAGEVEQMAENNELIRQKLYNIDNHELVELFEATVGTTYANPRKMKLRNELTERLRDELISRLNWGN